MQQFTVNELIENLRSLGDNDMIDFDIFQKSELDVYDHYKFWFRVLQDHMIFIIKRSSNGSRYPELANQYLNDITRMKDLLVNNNIRDFSEFNDAVISSIDGIRIFKQTILTELLQGPAKISLPPSFISHMLNELEKFRFITHYVKSNGEFPRPNSLNEHELWLTDIIGHLQGIKDNLDPVEKLIRKRLCKESKVFKCLRMKAEEFIGYARHNIVGGNHVEKLNADTIDAVLVYINLLDEITTLRHDNYALGLIDTHMLIHMIFEEIYYIKGLVNSTPNYDPLAANQIPRDIKSEIAVQSIQL